VLHQVKGHGVRLLFIKWTIAIFLSLRIFLLRACPLHNHYEPNE
jgi:hypothetical protein